MNVRNGNGFGIYQDGSSYRGSFKNDIHDGSGVFKWPQGHEYRGLFKEGMMEGNGEFSHSSGRVQKGLFRRNYFVIVSILASDIILGGMLHKSLR